MKKIPSNFKFEKNHKIKLKKNRTTRKASYLKTGLYGLKIYKNNFLEWKHREMTRRVFKKFLKKKTFFIINFFSWCPVYRKPINSRMGKGKGKLRYWVQPVQAGYVFCEINYYSNNIDLTKVFKRISSRLPGKTNLIKLVY